jgi:putative ABC transport system permease protein
MFRLALKSTMSNKRRLFSTAFSILLGVAFLAGTLVFTDTITRTFDDLFAGIYAETDSFVRPAADIELADGVTQRGRMPGSIVGEVAAVPGVSEADGIVQSYAQIVGADGKAIGNPGRGAPTLGMSYVAGALNPWELTEGSTAPGPDQLVVDAHSADVGDLHLGDTVTVLTPTGPHQFTLVGTARFGSADSPGGASVAIFDLPTAQRVLLGGKDEVDAVMADAVQGVDESTLTARIAAVVPTGIEVLTGTQVIKETQDVMHEQLGFVTTFLLVFAAIGFVVACFTIYNTFQIIVTQRTREMAMLRAVGATRQQVVRAQLLEAVFVGVVASVIGLFAGVLVAGGLKAMMAAVGIDIPAGGTVFLPRTAIVAITVGTVVTIASAVFPSLRASRVPPLAAVRDLAADTSGHPGRVRLIQGALLTVLGLGAFVLGLASGGLLWVGLGALLVFLGAFVLGPLAARPASRLLGAPVAHVSEATGALARQNAMRNPKRTARTGGALMVGVALVVAITVIAATAKDWTRDIFGNQFHGDYVVSTDSFGFGGLSPEVAQQLSALPQVQAAAGIRVGSAHDLTGGGDTSYVAVDPVSTAEVFDLGMVEGDLAALDDQGIMVDDGKAESEGLAVGDTVRFQFVNGTTRDLTVEGIYTEDDLAGPFVVTHAVHEQSGADQLDFSVYVAAAPGVSDTDARAAIGSVSDRFPNARLESRAEYIDAQAAQIDQLVNLMYGLLALAILIALLSIANSLSLSIHERTHELGLLRAVGMTRHQTGSTVRWEAGIVALLGTLFGALLGLFFGWSISVTLRGDGWTEFSAPALPIVVIIAVGVAGGLLSSIRPSWRAAHLDVLRAIATE